MSTDDVDKAVKDDNLRKKIEDIFKEEQMRLEDDLSPDQELQVLELSPSSRIDEEDLTIEEKSVRDLERKGGTNLDEMSIEELQEIIDKVEGRSVKDKVEAIGGRRPMAEEWESILSTGETDDEFIKRVQESIGKKMKEVEDSKGNPPVKNIKDKIEDLSRLDKRKDID